jgi:CRISPR-associated protein Cas1
MPTDSTPAAAPVPAPDARAKPLPRRLPLVGSAPDLVPARMINEALYCERLLYLEWAQGEFADNAFTVEGRAVHRRADQPGGKLPAPPNPAPEGEGAAGMPSDETADVSSAEARPYEVRTLWLTSERVGITARIDVVEGDAGGHVVPIEYKRGKAPDLPDGAYLPERAQLCAQVLLLREHGYRCDHGDIYFAGSRKRVTIAIDDALVATTLAAVARARQLTETTEAPPPLVDSPKCNGCSLVGICLPDEINLLRRLEGESVDDLAGAAEGAVAPTEEESGPDPWDLGTQPAPSPRVLRRLHPASDDKVPLYVEEQGARVGLDGDCLVVRGRPGSTGGATVTARLPNTSHVALYGNVQITAQALRALLERNVPVSFLSYGGWYYGRATGFDSKNVELRLAQHRAATDPEFCLRMARGLVASKVRNCRTLLRRNHPSRPWWSYRS